MMTKAWLSARQQNFQPLGTDISDLPDEASTRSKGPRVGNGGQPGDEEGDSGSGAGAGGGSQDDAVDGGGGAAQGRGPAAEGGPVDRPAGGDPPGGAGSTEPWKPADFETISRRIDDARALIPYIFGAFKHPNRHGLRLGLPMLQYCSPEIDLKTGKWKYHVNDTLNLIAKALQLSDLVPWGLLVQIDDADGKQKTALGSFLRVIDDVEEKIEESLVKHKSQIAKNYSIFRKAVFHCISEQLSCYAVDEEEEADAERESAWNEITQAIRVALLNENALEVKANESLNLKGSFGHPNESFGGSYLFDDILTALKKRTADGNQLLAAAYLQISEQESRKMDSILLTVRSVRRVYRQTIKALGGRDMMKSFRDALKKTKDTNATYSDIKGQNKVIDDYLSNLIAERVELLYCNVYTFFSAMIGKNHQDISKISLSFVNSVVLSALFPTLKAQHNSLGLSEALFQSAPQKDETAGQSLLRQLYEQETASYKSHMDILLKINPGDAKQHIKEISSDILNAIWDSNKSEIRQPISLNKIFLSGQLAYAQKHEGEMSNTTTKIKKILSAAKTQFKNPSTSAVNHANDLLFNVLQQAVSEDSRHRFSFNILSHAILVDQRSNPYFTVCYVLNRSIITDVDSAAGYFFKHSHSPFLPFSTKKHPPREGVADPFSGIWQALPASKLEITKDKANSFIARLALRNVDIISSFTRKERPQKAKPNKQPPKKKTPPAAGNKSKSQIGKKAAQKKTQPPRVVKGPGLKKK